MAMENEILKTISLITKDFSGKGLVDVYVVRLSSGALRVTFNFDVSSDEYVRVCASLDVKELYYKVSVYSASGMTYLAYCKYYSDFTETLLSQCRNLAELPF